MSSLLSFIILNFSTTLEKNQKTTFFSSVVDILQKSSLLLKEFKYKVRFRILKLYKGC